MTDSDSSSKGQGADGPNEVRKRIRQHKDAIDSAYIQMGRDLYLVYHRRLYQDWGHDTFTDYLEIEVGIDQQRGDRCKRIWTRFVKDEAISPKEMKGLGYTNALALLAVLGKEAPVGTKPRSARDWIGLAKKLSWRDLSLEIKKFTSISKEQKDALVASGATVASAEPEIPGLPAPISASDNRRDWGFKLHPSQFKVLDAAIAEAKRSKPGSMAENEALAHVATEFLAARMSKEEAPVARVGFLLTNLERVYGGKFVWVPGDEAADYLGACIEQRPELFNQPVVEDEEDTESDESEDDEDDYEDEEEDE